MKRLVKFFLLMFPRSFIKVDGFCPKCGYPLTVRSLGEKIYFVCKNPFCDYYSSGFNIPKELSDDNFIIGSKEERNNNLRN
jgi:tRNA(Ile2) C34 agmatinyltransferase TiaS